MCCLIDSSRQILMGLSLKHLLHAESTIMKDFTVSITKQYGLDNMGLYLICILCNVVLVYYGLWHVTAYVKFGLKKNLIQGMLILYITYTEKRTNSVELNYYRIIT